jgi:hypothetical protein
MGAGDRRRWVGGAVVTRDGDERLPRTGRARSAGLHARGEGPAGGAFRVAGEARRRDEMAARERLLPQSR